MRSSSRIIGADAFARMADTAGMERMNIGALGEFAPGGLRRRVNAAPPPPPPAPEPPPPDPAELMRAEREAGWREGFDAGYREGAQAFDDFRAQQLQGVVERFDAIARAYEARLREIEHQAADALIDLAVELARRTVRTALDVDRERVLPVAREALALLAESKAKPALRLHPDDAEVASTELAGLLERRNVTLVPDPSVEPGGCLLESAHATVDGSVATRWQRALATLGRDEPWVKP